MAQPEKAALGEEPLDDTTETTRVEAFSDGVFAIAITLLILEIRVPEEADLHGGLWRALGTLWPSYIGYLLSFVTIGIMWANHHAIFQYIRRTDRTFLLLNVLFLMCVSFLPFPTAVLARFMTSPAERAPAAAFYSVWLVVIALAFNLIWWYGAHDDRLMAAGCDHEGVRTISRRYAMGPFTYLLTVGLAFVSVAACLAVHAALAVLFALPEIRPRRRR